MYCTFSCLHVTIPNEDDIPESVQRKKNDDNLNCFMGYTHCDAELREMLK